MKEEPYIALTHYRDGRVRLVIVNGSAYTPEQIAAALEARDEYTKLLALWADQTAARVRAEQERDALHRNWAHERDYARAAHFRTSAWARAWKQAAKKFKGDWALGCLDRLALWGEVDTLRAERDALRTVVAQIDYFGEGLIHREYAPGSRTIAELVASARAALREAGDA